MQKNLRNHKKLSSRLIEPIYEEHLVSTPKLKSNYHISAKRQPASAGTISVSTPSPNRVSAPILSRAPSAARSGSVDREPWNQFHEVPKPAVDDHHRASTLPPIPSPKLNFDYSSKPSNDFDFKDAMLRINNLEYKLAENEESKQKMWKIWMLQVQQNQDQLDRIISRVKESTKILRN
jgi:hypothetical protein